MEVVVYKGLHQHLIYIGSSRWSCDRKQILHERSEQPMTLASEYNNSWSNAQLFCPEDLLRCRGEGNHWASTPNHRTGLGW